MERADRDPHGQPTNRALNARRLADRAVDELIGICRGVLADGAVSKNEAETIIRWMEVNETVASQWPANALYRRLREMLVDHTLDVEEEGESLELLLGITGGEASVVDQAARFSITLPLSIPAPDIAFDGRRFCLTGRFAYGSRKQCESQVLQRGGVSQAAPTRETDFLVIGVMGSSDWVHSTYGRKIEAAVALRERWFPIGIVSENHWARALGVI